MQKSTPYFKYVPNKPQGKKGNQDKLFKERMADIDLSSGSLSELKKGRKRQDNRASEWVYVRP